MLTHAIMTPSPGVTSLVCLVEVYFERRAGRAAAGVDAEQVGTAVHHLVHDASQVTLHRRVLLLQRCGRITTQIIG